MPEETMNLFEPGEAAAPSDVLGPGTAILHGFAAACAETLIEHIQAVSRTSPFRHLVTPGGFTMSVAMTNCGPLGWTSDRTGYRYVPRDPVSEQPWPGMPADFRKLAADAAAAAGFAAFVPDACLINRYSPGARLTLHQDKDETDYTQPIVSVSLGLPAVFQFGGTSRNDKLTRVPLTHGDIVVWGGPARLRYHGVSALKDGAHPLTGAYRYNLTFRKAG
jgi:DNA oxidative demethylase